MHSAYVRSVPEYAQPLRAHFISIFDMKRARLQRHLPHTGAMHLRRQPNPPHIRGITPSVSNKVGPNATPPTPITPHRGGIPEIRASSSLRASPKSHLGVAMTSCAADPSPKMRDGAFEESWDSGQWRTTAKRRHESACMPDFQRKSAHKIPSRVYSHDLCQTTNSQNAENHRIRIL